MAWSVELYESAQAGCPVREFLDGLGKLRRAKVLAVIALLGKEGPNLPFPYSSQVRGKIRELRTHYGAEQFRVLYFGSPRRTFVLLHAFRKRTEQTPDRVILTAEVRMRRYLEVFETEQGRQ
jgi:phage-related protein